MRHGVEKLITLLLCLALVMPNQALAAEPANPELSEKLTRASILLSGVMQQQYEDTVEEIKGIADREGYDYPLTAEAFTECGSPYKDMDWITLIATCSSINSRIKKTGKGEPVDLKSVRYITYTYEVTSIKEKEPHKVEEFEEAGDGLFRKTGFRYSDKEEDIPVWEEVEEGLYRKIGERHITPDEKEIPYMDVNFKVLVPDDLFTLAKLTKDDWFEDDIERRKTVLTKTTDNETLRSNVFIKLPENSIGAGGWMDLFLNAVGYSDEEHLIRISGNSIAGIASTLSGQVPYEWGGKADFAGYDTSWWTYDEDSGLQKGLDCSGFVQWCYITAGFPKEITDTLLSTHIMDGNYENVEGEIRPGDIGLNMSRKIGHCGIYAGDGKWWHCSSAAGTVVLADGAGLGFSKVIRPVDMEENIYYRSLQVYYPDKKKEAADAVIAEAKAREESQKKQKEEQTAKDAEVTQPVEEKSGEKAEIQKEEDNNKLTEQLRKLEEERAAMEQKVKDAIAQITMTAIEPAVKAGETVEESQQTTQEIQISAAPTVSASEEDVMLLAQLMTHEALNQGLNGWIAVGEVVRNRVSSSLFPNSYREVIFQKGQFTKSSELSGIKPRPEMIEAARGVMEGRLSVLGSTGVLYFRNAGGNNGNWGRHAVFRKIGQHTFYVQ